MGHRSIQGLNDDSFFQSQTILNHRTIAPSVAEAMDGRSSVHVMEGRHGRFLEGGSAAVEYIPACKVVRSIESDRQESAREVRAANDIPDANLLVTLSPDGTEIVLR